MVDMAARLAALRLQKQKEKEQENEKVSSLSVTSTNTPVVAASNDSVQGTQVSTPVVQTSVVPPAPASKILFTPAAEVTQDIDHIDFMSKMNSLQEAIHTQHPTLPVLLFQIHTQLRKDPEVVTLLTEDAIGVIVQGLEVQTKTKLVEVKLKESKASAKKTPMSADMF